MFSNFTFDSKFFTENPLWFGIFTYLSICFVLYVTKPQYFFDGNEPRQFGCYNKGETLFPFYIVALIGGILAYFLFTFFKPQEVIEKIVKEIIEI